MPKTIDLNLVRSADARLKRARTHSPNVTARPVPIAELVARGRVTLTVPELATLADLHPLTIRRAIAAGELKAANGGGRSHYRISRADAEAWWRGRGGGSLLDDVATVETPEDKAADILAAFRSGDLARRNAAIVELARSDAATSAIVDAEVSREVEAYDGDDDDFADWHALDGEPFHDDDADEQAAGNSEATQ